MLLNLVFYEEYESRIGVVPLGGERLLSGCVFSLSHCSYVLEFGVTSKALLFLIIMNTAMT